MRARSLWLTLLLLAIVGSVYLPSYDGEFVFDDVKLVLENDELWQGAGFDLDLFADRSADEVRTNYRPVRFASYKIDALLTQRFFADEFAAGEIPPHFFHLQNIFWHLVNCLLLLFLLRRFAAADAWWPWLAALLFGLHPLHTECVAYISGRRDVLFLSFYLLALNVFAARRTRAGWGTGVIVASCYLLALGAKEMAVTLPAAIVAVDLLSGGSLDPRRWPWRVLLPTTIVGAVFVAALLGVAAPGGGVGHWGGSAWVTLWTMPRVFFYYCRLLLWPHPLTIDYSFDAFPVSSDWLTPFTAIASVVGLLALLGVAIVAWRRGGRALPVAIVLFLATLAPVSQVLPHPERMGERFLYLPSIAFGVALAAAWAAWTRRDGVVAVRIGAAKVGAALALTAPLFLGWMTSDRIGDWQTRERLWGEAVRVSPRCARAHFAYANAIRQRPIERGRAIDHFGRAIDLLAARTRTPLEQGYYLQARSLRGSLLGGSRDPVELLAARADLESLLSEVDTDGTPVRDDPQIIFELLKVCARLDDADSVLGLARQLLENERSSDALKVEAGLLIYGDALEQPSADSGALLASIRAWAESSGQQARVEFQVGQLLLKRGDEEAALAAFRRSAERAAAVDEGSEEAPPRGGASAADRAARAISAWYMEAQCLTQLGRLDEAIARLEQIVELVPAHLASHRSLGDLYMGKGDPERAEASYRTVLASAPGDPATIEALRQLAVRKQLLAPQPAPALDHRARSENLLRFGRERQQAGELQEARDAYAKADASAEGPELLGLRRQARLALARLEVGGERWADAIAAYQSVLAISPSAADRERPVVELAEVLRRAEGAAAALRLLEQERRGGVVSALLHKNMGGLALALDDREAALRWYRLYLESEPPAAESLPIRQLVEQLATPPK